MMEILNREQAVLIAAQGHVRLYEPEPGAYVLEFQEPGRRCNRTRHSVFLDYASAEANFCRRLEEEIARG